MQILLFISPQLLLFYVRLQKHIGLERVFSLLCQGVILRIYNQMNLGGLHPAQKKKSAGGGTRTPTPRGTRS